MVRPKLVKSVHYVEKKNVFMTREYRDATMTANFIPVQGGNAYPTEDSDGNVLRTEYGYCQYRDHQKVILQEMPERAPPGQLPRSVEILLVDDLVDRIKPGDRVQVVGIYKALSTGSNGQIPGHFKTVLLANRVRHLGKETQMPLLTDLDIQNIKKVSKRDDLYALMGRSIAPSICGHEFIKKAILLMLLGGVEKNLENTHLRGDINLLLVCILLIEANFIYDFIGW
jgi:DNA replication licensing factor MCM3